jgi:hypothetical protein
MIILRDPQQITQVIQPDIQAFLRQRFRELKPYDPDEHGFFILVEPDDSIAALEAETGYPLLDPCFEYIADHGRFFEMTYLITDSGFGLSVIIPNSESIDGRLLALCAEYAEPFHPSQPKTLEILP